MASVCYLGIETANQDHVGVAHLALPKARDRGRFGQHVIIDQKGVRGGSRVVVGLVVRVLSDQRGHDALTGAGLFLFC